MHQTRSYSSSIIYKCERNGFAYSETYNGGTMKIVNETDRTFTQRFWPSTHANFLGSLISKVETMCKSIKKFRSDRSTYNA